MIENLSVLAVITARGGSKGLPGKNIRELCGKPLIAWTIEAGLASRLIDRLVVSTDSQEISEVCASHGLPVPALRPAHLAQDTTPSVDVLAHAIEQERLAGRHHDIVVLLEPTSPLREPGDIDAALEQMMAAGADSVVSVVQAESAHPAFMFEISASSVLRSIQPGGFKVLRRQDITPVYLLDGTVYAARVETLLEQRAFVGDNTAAYVVPKWKSPEIDDLIDFVTVEAIMKHRSEQQ